MKTVLSFFLKLLLLSSFAFCLHMGQYWLALIFPGIALLWFIMYSLRKKHFLIRKDEHRSGIFCGPIGIQKEMVFNVVLGPGWAHKQKVGHTFQRKHCGWAWFPFIHWNSIRLSSKPDHSISAVCLNFYGYIYNRGDRSSHFLASVQLSDLEKIRWSTIIKKDVLIMRLFLIDYPLNKLCEVVIPYRRPLFYFLGFLTYPYYGGSGPEKAAPYDVNTRVTRTKRLKTTEDIEVSEYEDLIYDSDRL